MYELTTLDNGLRVLSVPIPHTQSVCLGLFLQVGSRWESAELAGASHFIEHMLFKGTPRRPTARHIAEAIEGRGGIFNASTGVETTLLWAKVAAPHLSEAMDLFADMMLHAAFDAREIEKERSVIVEEIRYDLDTPDSLVQILGTQMQWPGQPLGRDVAGTPESVAKLSRKALLAYRAGHYLPGQAVLGLAGQVCHADAVALAQACLSEWLAGPPLACEPARANGRGPHLLVEFREIELAHVNFSFEGLQRSHPDRFVLHLMNVILGEGMRSRLFQEVRERLGLAYEVDSYVNLLQDTGSVGVYAGVATDCVEGAVEAIVDQLDRLRQEAVPEDELATAKEFSKGRLALGLEDSFAMASWYARQELLGPELLCPQEVVARIDRVQSADIQRLAQSLFQEDALNLAVVGPCTINGRLQQALHF